MLEKVQKVKDPKIFVITPLKEDDKISKVLRKTIKNNLIEFDWYTYRSDNNTAKNFQCALDEFKNLPFAVIKIDNDIELGNKMLDRLYDTLSKSEEQIAYSYCPFQFVGVTNVSFPPIEWNWQRLLKANYISSNSLIKSKVIREIPLIIDDYYKRLLDWAYWIHLGNNGYIGKLDNRTSFKAHTRNSSISANDAQDYNIKYKRVEKDFIYSPGNSS